MSGLSLPLTGSHCGCTARRRAGPAAPVQFMIPLICTLQTMPLAVTSHDRDQKTDLLASGQTLNFKKGRYQTACRASVSAPKRRLPTISHRDCDRASLQTDELTPGKYPPSIPHSSLEAEKIEECCIPHSTHFFTILHSSGLWARPRPGSKKNKTSTNYQTNNLL